MKPLSNSDKDMRLKHMQHGHVVLNSRKISDSFSLPTTVSATGQAQLL